MGSEPPREPFDLAEVIRRVRKAVRAYPKPATGGAVPTVSNLNLTKGATRANLAIVKPGDDGRVRIRNEGGFLHLIGDLAGYFL